MLSTNNLSRNMEISQTYKCEGPFHKFGAGTLTFFLFHNVLFSCASKGILQILLCCSRLQKNSDAKKLSTRTRKKIAFQNVGTLILWEPCSAKQSIFQLFLYHLESGHWSPYVLQTHLCIN